MKTARINLDVLAAVSLCASTEETRYYLNGVCLEITPRSVTYVTTDGHRLMTYRDDVPEGDDDNTLIGTLIVPIEHCKPFKLGKRSDGICALQGETVTGPLTFNYLDSMLVGFKPIDGTFPDWRRVLPNQYEPEPSFTFDWNYVQTFQKIARALDLCQAPYLMQNGGNPAFVWFGDHEHCFGVIMPRRAIDMTARRAPEWVNQRTDFAQAAE